MVANLHSFLVCLGIYAGTVLTCGRFVARLEATLDLFRALVDERIHPDGTGLERMLQVLEVLGRNAAVSPLQASCRWCCHVAEATARCSVARSQGALLKATC